MKQCSVCKEPATIFSKQTNLCVIHYRMRQMRYDAQASGKVIPTDSAIQALFDSAAASGMKCSVCSVKMNWLKRDGVKTIATLQHDRDGTFRLLCLSCNVKHQFWPEDSFYTREPGHKRCTRCEATLPLDKFRVRDGYPNSTCRKCDSQMATIRVRELRAKRRATCAS